MSRGASRSQVRWSSATTISVLLLLVETGGCTTAVSASVLNAQAALADRALQVAREVDEARVRPNVPLGCGAPNGARPEDVPTEENSENGNDTVKEVDAYVACLARGLASAKASKDVVRSLCLDDKFKQLKLIQKTVAQRTRPAMTTEDQETEQLSSRITDALVARARLLVAEAEQCIGEEVAFVGNQNLVVAAVNIVDEPEGCATMRRDTRVVCNIKDQVCQQALSPAASDRLRKQCSSVQQLCRAARRNLREHCAPQ